MRLKPLTTASIVLLLGLTGVVAAAYATPITYTEEATATGSLGASSFSDALVTITLTGDTSAVTGVTFFLNVGPATVTVAGIGTAAFTDLTEAVDTPSPPRAGVADVTQFGAFILAVEDAAFASYDLKTAFGPVVGSPVFNPGQTFPTALGDFSLTAVGDVTFTATTEAPVPLPASILLLGTALAGFAGLNRARSRATSRRQRPAATSAAAASAS
jgi:hypothetical protein